MKNKITAIAGIMIGAMLSTTALADGISALIPAENSAIRTDAEIKSNPVTIQDYVNIVIQDADNVAETSESVEHKSRWQTDDIL